MVMLTVLISSCKFNCSTGGKNSAKKVSTPEYNKAIEGATIKNDIELEVTGVKLKSAYLTDANNNPLQENETRINEKIYLIIEVDTGWVKEGKTSFIGASERITTSAGKIIVSADDIFKSYETTGMDAKDAEFISLSAVITSASSGLKDFTVHFRVWDKKGPGEIKGKYKFKITK